MGIIEIIVLALGLSMDSFAVSIMGGVVLKKFCWKKAVKIGFFLGMFQALMPLLGWLAGKEFKHLIENYDHWIAFGVLLLLGVKMIIESLRKENPEQCCFDPSDTKTLIGLSLATSIDALAVGISFAFLNINMCSPTIIIGLTTFICSIAGIYTGVHFGKRIKTGAEIMGGVILILIGIKILMEHLYS